MMSNPFGRAAWVLALALSAACAPVVTHGPRVDPGLRVVFTAGTPRPLCDTGCADNLIPMLGLGLRYGYAPQDPAKPALMVTLTAPVFDVASPQLDLFVEGPGRDGAWAYGAGGMVSPTHVVPYAQVGRQPGGYGPYVTGAYVWITRDIEWAWDEGADGESERYAVLPRYWMPQLGVRLPSPRGAVDLYLAGAFGRSEENTYVYDPETQQDGYVAVRRPVRLLMAGISIAFDASAGLPFPFP